MVGVLLFYACFHLVFWFHVLSFLHETIVSKNHDVAKNFTTAVKIKVFSGEDDLFDDIFQQKSTLEEIMHAAQIQFSPEEFQQFKIYRERRLASIPLEKLRLEPAREPTPSVSLSGSSGTNGSKSKSGKETFEHSKIS